MNLSRSTARDPSRGPGNQRPDRWLSRSRRRVLIVDREEEPALTSSLDGLDLDLDWRTSRSGYRIDDARGATAAIVNETVDGALQICSSLAPACPVILLSERPSFGLRLAAAEAGVSAVSPRPVVVSEIAQWLDHFADLAAQDSLSVLIVDDDTISSEIYSSVLQTAGMTVRSVVDPKEALRVVEEASPDIILMDLQMPVVDGLKLAQMIRQMRVNSALPIVFLSAERDEGRQMLARQFGGDDFIDKSIPPEKLPRLVKLRADRAKAMRSLIERDGLTGLYDARRFKERLWQEFERCRRSKAAFSLVSLDIDHFKRVNDTFGHPTGDDVIRTLASSLTSGLRRIDIVGRCGGEEFGVIMLDTEPAAARIVTERLRDRFAGFTFHGDGRPFAVTFSAGVASSRDHADLGDLVAAADGALYAAKRSGRNRIEVAGSRLKARRD